MKMCKHIDWLPEFKTITSLFEWFGLEEEDNEINIESFTSVYEKQKLFIENRKKKAQKHFSSEEMLNSHYKLVNLVVGDSDSMNPKTLIKEWKENRQIDTLIKIKNNFKKLPEGWIAQFFEDGGLDMITMQLSSTNILSGYPLDFELEEQKLIIQLLRSMIKTNIGFNFFLKDTNLFRFLILILTSSQDDDLISSISLLISIACSVGEDEGFNQVLNAFQYTFIVKNEKKRFQSFIELFDKVKNVNTNINLLLLLNELLASSPNDSISFEIYQDLKDLNIYSLHQRLGLEMTNDYLDTQLEILKDLLDDISTRNVISIEYLNKKIQSSFGNSFELKNNFVQILQDVHSLSQNNL
jgi:gluconate kinase